MNPRALAALAAALIATPTLACGLGGQDKPTDPPTTGTTAPKGGHVVRFEVTAASGRASLVNWSTVEDASVVNDVATPWSKEVVLEDRYGLVGVNATSSDGKTISCRLFVDGRLVDEGESAGTVNCSDTVKP